jgi:hypothetical protein
MSTGNDDGASPAAGVFGFLRYLGTGLNVVRGRYEDLVGGQVQRPAESSAEDPV